MAKETRISPFCAHLRTKKYFFLTRPALTEDDILDGSGRSWCQHTMEALGPDGELVDPEDCRSQRRCFESIGPKGGPEA